MKKTKLLALGIAALFAPVPLCTAQSLDDQDYYEEDYGYDSWDEMDDFDSLFADAQDIEDAVETTPVTPASAGSSSSSAISFSGSTSLNLGGLAWIYGSSAGTITPAASFSSSLNFTARPSSSFTVHGGLSASFPEFKLNLSSLYVDYIMFDKIYLTAGKTAGSWGNAFFFDTNILNDSRTDSVNQKDTQNFIKGSWEGTDTAFSVIATIPVKKGEAQALVQLQKPELNVKYLSYAAKIEYPVFGVNLSAFAKVSAKDEETHKSPAIGLSASGDLGDWMFNLWGSMNVTATLNPEINYGRFVAGIGRYWSSNPKMALNAEYCFVYDNQSGIPQYSNKLGFMYAWSHVAGSAFSPTLQCFMNVENLSGAVVPALTVSGLSGLPYLKLNITAPVFFGNQTVEYQGITINSTAQKPAVLFGIIASIAVSY